MKKNKSECCGSPVRTRNADQKEKKRCIILAVLVSALFFIAAFCIVPTILNIGREPKPNNSGAFFNGNQPDNSDKNANSDLKTEIPPDFAIHFETWINENQKNVLDTYEGYVQKDLVINGVKKTIFKPDAELLEAIYAKIQACRLNTVERKMTNDVLMTGDLGYCVTPLTCYSIRFTAYGKTYTITGDATAQYYTGTDADASNFCNFVQYMCKILYESEAYKSLPAQNGGYS
ncbi:MAG: hypothetical protein PUE85_02205 [Firmicutes bacterium]|nr:hypothetical protein [Bacillota bacterium]